jgi:large subunit ribosomal protein L27e
MSAEHLVARGRFVILTNGRHAGKKAVILQSYPDATESRKYPHAIVLGIDKAPKKLTKDMSQEALVKRTQLRCFVKTVNFGHFLLTRHVLKDDDFWGKVKPEEVLNSLTDATEKKAMLNTVTAVVRQKYLNNKIPWFFKNLQF